MEFFLLLAVVAVLASDGWLGRLTASESSAANHCKSPELTHLNELLEDEPDNLGLLRQRASLLGVMNEHELKIRDLDHLLELGETSAPIYNDRAWALAQLGRYQEALPDARKSVELAPENDHPLDTLGYVLVGLKSYQEAVEVYDKALAIRPNKLHSLWGRGVAQKSLGRTRAAQADFRAADQQDPKFKLEWAPAAP